WQQWSDIQPGGGQVIRRLFNRRPCRAVNRVRFANEDPARVALQTAVARAGLGNPHKAAGRTPPANTWGAVHIPHGASGTNSASGHQESLRICDRRRRSIETAISSPLSQKTILLQSRRLLTGSCKHGTTKRSIWSPPRLRCGKSTLTRTN